MKFSVIIPVFNVEDYVKDCLVSVRESVQHLKSIMPEVEIEVVCVDDGSTDCSGAIVDSFVSSENRNHNGIIVYKVFHQKNAGVSAARNMALKCALGDYVCFVDADDVVRPGWLLSYAKMAFDTDADLIRIGGKFGCVNSSSLQDWLWNTFVGEGYPWKYAIKRSVAITRVFPIGVTMSEDSIYAARVSNSIRTAAELGVNQYDHIVRQGSAMFRKLSSRERLRYLICWLKIVRGGERVNKVVASMLVASGVLAWMSRPIDLINRKLIRRVWLQLKANGVGGGAGVHPLYLMPYYLYVWFGWITPTRVWSWLIQRLICARGVKT